VCGFVGVYFNPIFLPLAIDLDFTIMFVFLNLLLLISIHLTSANRTCMQAKIPLYLPSCTVRPSPPSYLPHH
jgi:hypothetical protein